MANSFGFGVDVKKAPERTAAERTLRHYVAEDALNKYKTLPPSKPKKMSWAERSALDKRVKSALLKSEVRL